MAGWQQELEADTEAVNCANFSEADSDAAGRTAREGGHISAPPRIYQLKPSMEE
jgi:hypothetical protein